MLMLSLRNRWYVAFFRLGAEAQAKNLRKSDPRMKHSRLDTILQTYPTGITIGQVYGRR